MEKELLKNRKDREKAKNIYIDCLNETKDIRAAAELANKKGYNWTVEYPSAWYEAINVCLT